MLPQLQDPSSPLAAVLQRSDIWIGDRLARSRETLSSGYSALDAQLPGGGWPRGGLVDLMHARAGIGEIALLLPALAALTVQDEWVVIQASPQRLFAPAWRAAGVQLSRLIVIESVTGAPRLACSDTLWAAEQMLRAGSVSAALIWLPRSTSTAQLRRLQVAAEAGGTLAFLLQDESRCHDASPAPLRLRLEVQFDGLAIHLLKRRGAPLARPVVLPLSGQGRIGEAAGHSSAGTASNISPNPTVSVPTIAGMGAPEGRGDSPQWKGVQTLIPQVCPLSGEPSLTHALARTVFPKTAA